MNIYRFFTRSLLGVLCASGFLFSHGVLLGQSTSMNPADLFGKWKVESGEGYSRSSRTFEFFPDGTVIETSTHVSESRETETNYKKKWSAGADSILILTPGADGREGQSISIPLPFDPLRMQIVETWESPTSTRTTRMTATRVGPSSPSSPPTVRTQTPAPTTPPKIEVSVVPSVKSSRESYMKVERISLKVTLRNQSLRSSTGPLKVSYWVFGKSDDNINLFWTFLSGGFDCNLGSDGVTRATEHTSQIYTNRFYDSVRVISGSDHFEYDGWIVRVTDAAGNLVAVKASKPQWEKLASQFAGLEQNRGYDLGLNAVQGSVGPPRYN